LKLHENKQWNQMIVTKVLAANYIIDL